MATLQAALKRGIEMSFQIEESELVSEPLPNLDERRALLFYEAAEGGAGVLTRIASDPKSLAQVASNALKLMHHDEPEGAWEVQALPELEQVDQHGHRICEAGCYQCLLSYFNQPDHQNINRRNEDVLKLLVALANAEVTPQAPMNSPSSDDNDDELLASWLQELDLRGLMRPDEVQVSVNAGAAVAAGRFDLTRALVFLQPINEEVANLLCDKGWQVIDMSDPDQWGVQLDAHPDVFVRNQTANES